MTHRQRYTRTLTFGEKPDRIHYAFGNPRKATVEAWYLQGLARMSPCPSDYSSPPEFGAFVGNDPVEKLSICTDVHPEFEIRVLEEDEHHRQSSRCLVFRFAYHSILLEYDVIMISY